MAKAPNSPAASRAFEPNLSTFFFLEMDLLPLPEGMVLMP